MDFRKGTAAELFGSVMASSKKNDTRPVFLSVAELFGSVMASSKKTFISNGTRPVFLSVLLLPELTGIDDWGAGFHWLPTIISHNYWFFPVCEWLWPTLRWALTLSGRGKGVRMLLPPLLFALSTLLCACVWRGQSLIFHEHSTFPFHKAEARVLFCSQSVVHREKSSHLSL